MSQYGVHRLDGSAFSQSGQDGLIHRAFLRGEGFSAEEVRRRPVIGVCSTWSELNPCNNGLREVAEQVKKGVAEAGGIALEFPVISLSEPYSRPSSMYLRNLMSMDVEEMVKSLPIDGVVLLVGCDKTVPASLMGAISAGKPALMVAAGHRLVACWQGNPCTVDGMWSIVDQRRRGELSDDDWAAFEGTVNSGVGTCNVLGTAITMAAISEVLGFCLPGSSLVPAATPDQALLSAETGRAIVDTVARGTVPIDHVTMASLQNAFRVAVALGGSTNAVVHLEAIAGRAGLRIGMDKLSEWARSTPYVTDVRPSGRYLLSDLRRVGGVPAVVDRIRSKLDLGTKTATGLSWEEQLRGQRFDPHDVIAAPGEVFNDDGGMRILSGSLAPGGAVMKTAGSGAFLRSHSGAALVFEGVDDMHAKIDDPSLDVDASMILVLRGVGMHGGPGMPEVGHIPIPAKLAAAGVTDMLRVTDARMSGTATGSIVLHVAPESAVGGPLAYVENGDTITFDLDAGRLDLMVDSATLAARAAERRPSPRVKARGYEALHRTHALQPDEGCDFDFLQADGSEQRESAEVAP